MEKVSLGICIAEKEYEKRICGILMNHYRGKVSLHIFSSIEEIGRNTGQRPDGYILDDFEVAKELSTQVREKVFCLCEEPVELSEEKKVIVLEKYTDVGRIMGQVIAQIGSEIKEICEYGELRPKTRFIAIYGLCRSEFQLPFAMTLGAILEEHEKVLLLDLQENSGIAEYGKPDQALGLEDLLLLAKREELTPTNVQSAIGSEGAVDYIYPAENTEVYSEATLAMYENILSTIRDRMEYTIVLINLGTRFQGFFELLNQCRQIYMLQGAGGLGRWREYEFVEEVMRRGYQRLVERITKVEIPMMAGNITSCGTLVNQWRWDEFGEKIRKLSLRVDAMREASVG